MSPPTRRPARALHGVPGLIALIGLCALAGCQDRNRGISPDGQGLYFPSGVVLDPRVPATQQARWLFVLNANSDLVYNAGTLVPADLERFFASWMANPAACFADDPDPAACRPGPCVDCVDLARDPADPDGAKQPKVGDVGAEPTEDVPCRRNAFKPQVIECEETFFLEEDAAVHVGNFGTSLRGWTPQPVGDAAVERGKLFMAVRGDPSVTIVDVSGPVDEVPEFACGQGANPNIYDKRRCTGKTLDDGDVHLLTYLRNDDGSVRLPSEPSNILAIPGVPYVLVTHATKSALTLIDMNGQYVVHDKTGDPTRDKDGPPAIVQMRSVFELNGALGGGWGLAMRPCDPDDPPALTFGRGPDGELAACQRPLFYAGFRTSLYISRIYVDEIDPQTDRVDLAWAQTARDAASDRIAQIQMLLDQNPSAEEQEELERQLAEQVALVKFYDGILGDGDGPAQPFDQRCLLASELSDDQLADEDFTQPWTKGAFLCDARMFGGGVLRAAAFDTGVGASSAVLGDIAFSRDGNRMFVVQTNPGGLAYVDTSVDADGHTRDVAAGGVELCASPTALALFHDGEAEYAAVTCYKPSELFIVDLGGVRVVANIALGTGPHPMTVDPARNLMYIANTLDKTISVVDLSPKRPTRFVEIARLGRQVPYTR